MNLCTLLFKYKLHLDDCITVILVSGGVAQGGSLTSVEVLAGDGSPLCSLPPLPTNRCMGQ